VLQVALADPDPSLRDAVRIALKSIGVRSKHWW
jgi:hypothetical protein